MRIDEGQNILGYPAVLVRRLMREAARRPLSVGRLQEILECSDCSARALARELQAVGFVELVDGHLEPSIKGNALALATASPPLRRVTAERLIGDVVRRADAVNRDRKWAYQVSTLVLFGSCARGAKRPNDVDSRGFGAPPSTYAPASLDIALSSMRQKRSGARSRSRDLHRSTAGSCTKHRIRTRISALSISRLFGILLSPDWPNRRAFAPNTRLPASPSFIGWA